MRIATTAVLVVAFVCVSRVDASIFGSVKDSIGSLVETINDNVNKAVGTLEDGINKAKSQADQAIEDVKDVAGKIEKNIKQAVDEVVQSVDKQVDQAIKDAEKVGADVTECKVVSKMGEAATTIVEETVSCATNTADKAINAVTDAFIKSVGALTQITGLKKKAEECAEKRDSILDRVKATSCLTSVNAKSALQLTGVPSVISNLLTAVKKIVVLPPNLAACVSKTAIGTLSEQGKNVVDNVKRCIAEKTGKSKRN